jgi:hypothetical protein
LLEMIAPHVAAALHTAGAALSHSAEPPARSESVAARDGQLASIH